MSRNDGLALPPGVDPRQLARQLAEMHDEFVGSGRLGASVRSVVRDSWQRSVSLGVDPEGARPSVRLDEAEVVERRAAHPLALVMPVIRRLLVDPAADAGFLVGVSDAVGCLLWVEGDPRLRGPGEGTMFVPGADWSEGTVGTNAPGTALQTGRPVQLLGPEHLARGNVPFSCSAAPIREPDTGAILGVIDLSGGPDMASPQTLALVRATVAAAEAELRLDRLRRDVPVQVLSGWAAPRLSVLGRRGAVLQHGTTSTTLTLRHSEILLLLSEQPDGLSAGELGEALTTVDHQAVTIRAELSRLRTVLGPVQLSSRPYALRSRLDTDVAEVREHLEAGRLRSAVASYRGPVLPASSAPGVAAVREDLHLLLRTRLLAGHDADALLAFADTSHGSEDAEIWQAAQEALPASSPRAAEVRARLERLDLRSA